MQEQMAVPPVAVIGVGNLLMSDEGIGIHVIRALMRRGMPHRIELIDGGTGGLALLNLMHGRERVIIVDAVSLRAPPGAVFRWTPAPSREPFGEFLSAHTEGVQDILQAGRMLFHLPSILCIGIVPWDVRTPGTSPSRALRRRLPQIVGMVVREAIQRRPPSARRTPERAIPRT
jgi:hydrogenase maturation protease